MRQPLLIAAFPLRPNRKCMKCSASDFSVAVCRKIRRNVAYAACKSIRRQFLPVHFDDVFFRCRAGIHTVFNPMYVFGHIHLMRMRRNVYAVPMFRQIERLRWNQQADIHLVIMLKLVPMRHIVRMVAEAVRMGINRMPMRHRMRMATEAVRMSVNAVPMAHSVAVFACAGRAARPVVTCVARFADRYAVKGMPMGIV